MSKLDEIENGVKECTYDNHNQNIRTTLVKMINDAIDSSNSLESFIKSVNLTIETATDDGITLTENVKLGPW